VQRLWVEGHALGPRSALDRLSTVSRGVSAV
jgi:hypothetical protein